MIYLDATTTITLSGLQSGGNYINNATVVATLNDLDGNTLATVDLSSVDSTGDYSGSITPADTSAMTVQQAIVVEITASVGDAIVDFRRETHLAIYRGFND